MKKHLAAPRSIVVAETELSYEKEFRLVLESQTGSLRQFESFLSRFKDSFSITDTIYETMLFAVSEAILNAIHYGNKGDGQKRIFLLIRYSPETISFTLEDEGTGFDFEKIEDPILTESEGNTGRGIYVMQQLSDSFQYSENGKRLNLVFQMKL